MCGRSPAAQRAKAMGLPAPVSLKAMSPGRPEANCHSALSRMMASAHCCRSRVPTSMSMTATCTSWRSFGAPVCSSTGAPAAFSGRPRSQAAKLAGRGGRPLEPRRRRDAGGQRLRRSDRGVAAPGVTRLGPGRGHEWSRCQEQNQDERRQFVRHGAQPNLEHVPSHSGHTGRFRGGVGEVFQSKSPVGDDPPGSVAAERPVGLYAYSPEVPEDMFGERVAPFLKAPVLFALVAATSPSAGPPDPRSGCLRVFTRC